MRFQAMGLRGDADFAAIIDHMQTLGGDAVLMDPDKICGSGHLLSAAMHAERAFAEGTNRSNSLPTEIILYAAWDRQIGRALAKMRPAEDSGKYAAILIDIDDPRLEDIGMVRDDSLLDASEEKASAMGLDMGMIQPEDADMEMVAILALQKV